MSTVSTKPKKYTYFIGIDVSRNKLDFAVLADDSFVLHQITNNAPDDILSFINSLKKLPKFTISKALFCMENTGIYCNFLLNCFKKLKANAVLENPYHLKHSLGLIRGKSDKLDAIRIANYIYQSRNNVRLWLSKRPIIDQLMQFTALRSRLITIQGILKIPLKEQLAFITTKQYLYNNMLCINSLNSVIEDITNIDLSIDGIVKADERISRLMTIITSVPGVGRITALQVIISTNEFLDITDPKKFACFAGIAPFKNESGTVIASARISHMGNKKIKTLLSTCALSSIRYKNDLQEYYLRKTEVEKKPKRVVLNAVRNKIVLRIFACLHADRCFEL